MKALIIGPQGAGKGTQAQLLAAARGIVHISTGDILRANVGLGTELGKAAQHFMDAGELVPDDITNAMVAARLAEPDTAAGYLLDGFPRNIGQATWLDGLLGERGTPLDAVVLLTAPDAVVIERMVKRGRADDTPAAIQRRLDIYHSETSPLIDFYAARVIRVDGVGPVDEVHQRILQALGY